MSKEGKNLGKCTNNQDKNDDNYGPRRNGVKNSWGLKLLGLLLALMPNFIQISSKSDK